MNDCPYCKSTNIIKRGTAQRSLGERIQIYGCNDCKRRFTVDGEMKKESPIDPTIALYELKIKELESANKTLLDNNIKLAAENSRLTAMTDVQHSKLLTLEKEKAECKQKCEVVISEKDRRIQSLEEYKAGCKSTFDRLRGGTWTINVQRNNDGSIALTHTVTPA